MGSRCWAWQYTTSPHHLHHHHHHHHTGEMRTLALLLLLMIATATAFPLSPAEDGTPLIRRKRFIDITGLVPTIFRASFFPTPFFPTNFIGLQVTLPAPKIKRRVRG